jgi:Tfp pilus assembly protein PilO
MQAKKFFFIMTALLLLSLVGIVGAFIWGKSQLETKASEMSMLLAERDATHERILRLQKAQGDTDNLEEITLLLDQLLPSEKQQDTLIADVIYTATAEAGIPFSQVSAFSFTGGNEPSDLSGTTLSEDQPGIYEYPFTLQINNISYATLLNLLVEIETNGRIVQVDNIQIAPDGDNPNNVSVNLSTKAYLKP